MADKLMNNPDILLCSELIREFLEFYKMTYTLQVFVPECNLPKEDKVRFKIDKKLKFKRSEPNMPALIQLLNAYQFGENGMDMNYNEQDANNKYFNTDSVIMYCSM